MITELEGRADSGGYHCEQKSRCETSLEFTKLFKYTVWINRRLLLFCFANQWNIFAGWLPGKMISATCACFKSSVWIITVRFHNKNTSRLKVNSGVNIKRR
jgi:hypothetical protein